MRKATDFSKPITREDVQKALKEFLSHGGHIEVLPSREVEIPHYVGSDKFQSYESIQNLFYSTDGRYAKEKG